MLSLQDISYRMEIAMLFDYYASATDYTAFAKWDDIAWAYPKIRAWLVVSLTRSSDFQHIIAKEISLDGDAGTGRTLCADSMAVPLNDADGRLHVGFHGLGCIDNYRREGEGWRIASRRELRCFSRISPATADG